MDRHRRPAPPTSSSPPPQPSTTRLLRDLSNYKTPRGPHRNVSSSSPSPLFFTAAKNTPSTTAVASVRRRNFSSSATARSAAARRLKDLELDQTKSSRKVEIKREHSLKCFSKGATAWLNFLFSNPKACGCDINCREIGNSESLDSFDGGQGQSQKRRRNENGGPAVLTPEATAKLKVSLKKVCSVEDLKGRLEMYMSKQGCNEVLTMMSQVCKNIDEGRLKMKTDCPMVTDLGQKEKATATLFCYNPTWLRIGLYIVFGGDSLQIAEVRNRGQEDLFLKMIIEKQLLAHTSVAKSYAYNKLVDGLYKPGYFESLGKIILKRFMLIVMSLDKAKSEGTLSLKHGIDGIDGGSPLLFCRQSHIKSSRQMIHEFLFEAMHGEGDLLGHLITMGCKVSYEQLPVVEYIFKVSNLFDDLQDGLLLCRSTQLLLSDSLVLQKLVAPADTNKKKLHNCSIAMQHLKQAGIPLCDGDGVLIAGHDVVSGDKDLVLSLLWNLFLHLQVPKLITRTALVTEISRIEGPGVDFQNDNKAHMSLILDLIQAVCKNYDVKVDGLSSLNDGRAFCCLLDYYFRTELSRYDCSDIKENHYPHFEELCKLFDIKESVPAHNVALVQDVAAILWSIPEILQGNDPLDQETGYDDRCLGILSAFLVSKVISKTEMDQAGIFNAARMFYHKVGSKSFLSSAPISEMMQQNDYSLCRNNILKFDSLVNEGSAGYEDGDLMRNVKLIQDWWRTFTLRKQFIKMRSAALVLQAAVRHYLSRKQAIEIQQESAAILIQTQFRGSIQLKKYLKMKMAASLLQTFMKAWLAVTSGMLLETAGMNAYCDSSSGLGRYLRYMVDRHKFVQIKRSALVIQRATRTWIQRRNCNAENCLSCKSANFVDGVLTSNTVHPDSLLEVTLQESALILLEQNRDAVGCNTLESQRCSATAINGFMSAAVIQSHWRRLVLRRSYLCQVGSIIEIQTSIRSVVCQRKFIKYTSAAIDLQCFIRGQISWRRLSGASQFIIRRPYHNSSERTSNSLIDHSELQILVNAVVKLQRWWKQILVKKSRELSAIWIQSCIRAFTAQKKVDKQKQSIAIIQRRWRKVLFNILMKRSVLMIQAHVRGWIARRAALRNLHRIVVIQAYWRGCIIRKGTTEELLVLRYRLQRSTSRVDNGMKLINRLGAALSELRGLKSISSIRHICETFNIVTKHSQKCCDVLVAAGAIHILLEQFHLLNRGVPDQEVIKHILCTLKNIACYPQHLHLLSDSQSVEIIFTELLRNKNEGFLIACEILRRVCLEQQGLNNVRGLSGHTKRLNAMAQELERKAKTLKRKGGQVAVRDNMEKRWRDAGSLLLLIGDP